MVRSAWGGGSIGVLKGERTKRKERVRGNLKSSTFKTSWSKRKGKENDRDIRGKTELVNGGGRKGQKDHIVSVSVSEERQTDNTPQTA